MTSQTEPLKAEQPLSAVTVDILVEAGDWPTSAVLEPVAAAAVDATMAELQLSDQPTELSLVFTDDAAIALLNAQWRGKQGATNVLSFPGAGGDSDGRLPRLLGDVILAYQTISREADLEDKPFEHHLCHLIVHGLLHLLGYDHATGSEAEVMEATERRVLARLAIPDPYA